MAWQAKALKSLENKGVNKKSTQDRKVGWSGVWFPVPLMMVLITMYYFVTLILSYQLHFFFLQYWGLNSGPSPWGTPSAQFFSDKVSWDRVLQTICLGWLQSVILLISASRVARIIGWATSACHQSAFNYSLCSEGSCSLSHGTTRPFKIPPS
jgi:hypothetical protein